MTMKPQSVEQVQQAVVRHERVMPVGRRTKPSLSLRSEKCVELEMTSLCGITEYEPGEFVFSAWAGTPLELVDRTLSDHAQYLPFDPPWVAAGATLGGTVAAGLSGSGRLRYGGVRDFLIGVQLVDGLGRLISAGGKVVKNAAGFDLSKLVVGSRGQLGVLTQLTFKVFPRPRHRVTAVVTCRGLEDALKTLVDLASGAWDLEALDLEPPATLHLRMAGHEQALVGRAEKLRSQLSQSVEWLDDDREPEYWARQREFDWLPSGSCLVKVPLTAAKIPALEQELSGRATVRRYSVAGNLAWLSWPEPGTIDELSALLEGCDLQGLVILGDATRVEVGRTRSDHFLARVRLAMDPEGRFRSEL